MSDSAGSSIAAIQQRQAALSRQHHAAAAADRVLAETLASAHAAARDSVRRLDAIDAEIDRVRQVGLAADTPLGARDLQRFLLEKQREIAAVVAGARELSIAKSAVLQRLQETYAPTDGSAGTGR